VPGKVGNTRRVLAAKPAPRALHNLEPVVTDTGSISDGFHTFDELYEFRRLYHAHAVRAWLAARYPVVRSWKHHDGEPCFGGGWFIVVAQLPTGQVSNHYRANSWSLFGDVPEVETAPVWDGHSTTDVARRLRTLLIGDGSTSVAS